MVCNFLWDFKASNACTFDFTALNRRFYLLWENVDLKIRTIISSEWSLILTFRKKHWYPCTEYFNQSLTWKNDPWPPLSPWYFKKICGFSPCGVYSRGGITITLLVITYIRLQKFLISNDNLSFGIITSVVCTWA